MLIAVVISLSSCDASIEQSPGEKIRPVKSLVVDDTGMGGERRFPGRIESARRVELAFRVAGSLKELPVKEGDEVTAGAVIARLDDADFKTAFDDRKAVFTRTAPIMNAPRSWSRTILFLALTTTRSSRTIDADLAAAATG